MNFQQLRELLGRPFLTGHSGCEGGPFVRLRYENVGDAIRAHQALVDFLYEYPGFSFPAPDYLNDDALDRPERLIREGTNREDGMTAQGTEAEGQDA